MVHHLSRAPARTERVSLAPVKRIPFRQPNSTQSDDFLQHSSNGAPSGSRPPLVRSHGGQIFLTRMRRSEKHALRAGNGRSDAEALRRFARTMRRAIPKTHLRI